MYQRGHADAMYRDLQVAMDNAMDAGHLWFPVYGTQLPLLIAARGLTMAKQQKKQEELYVKRVPDCKCAEPRFRVVLSDAGKEIADQRTVCGKYEPVNKVPPPKKCRECFLKTTHEPNCLTGRIERQKQEAAAV